MLSEREQKMRARTLRAIVVRAPEIAEPCKSLGLEPMRLLKAFAIQESGLGTNLGEDGLVRRRIEPIYAPGGKYYRRSEELRIGHEEWGLAVSASHGPWQIMWATAIRFGWPKNRDPHELGSPEPNCEIATKIFLKELTELYSLRQENANPRYKTVHPVELLADAYNSGNMRDAIIPTAYADKVCQHYKFATETEGYP